MKCFLVAISVATALGTVGACSSREPTNATSAAGRCDRFGNDVYCGVGCTWFGNEVFCAPQRGGTCSRFGNNVYCGSDCRFFGDEVYCAEQHGARCDFFGSDVYCGVDCRWVASNVVCTSGGRARPATAASASRPSAERPGGPRPVGSTGSAELSFCSGRRTSARHELHVDGKSGLLPRRDWTL
jgi:hypothetical protein